MANPSPLDALNNQSDSSSDSSPLESSVFLQSQKGKGGQGAIPINPEDSKDILSNMQDFIKQRTNGWSQFMNGINRAYATAHGPEALVNYDRQKAAEEQQIMGYQEQLGAYAAAQRQQHSNDQLINGSAGAGMGGDSSGGANIGGIPLSPTTQQWLNKLNSTNPQQAALEISKLNQQAFKDQSGMSYDPAKANAGITVWDAQGNSDTVPYSYYLANKNKYSLVAPSGGVPTNAPPVVQNAPPVVQNAPPVGVPNTNASSTESSAFMQSPAALTANKIGKTTGDFTDDEIDRLRGTESGKDKFAVNSDSKAMGPYQYTAETLQNLARRGIVFSPFDEKQSREVAKNELNRLSSTLGSKELALTSYGGFKQKDPTGYISGILQPTTAATTATAPGNFSNLGPNAAEALRRQTTEKTAQGQVETTKLSQQKMDENDIAEAKQYEEKAQSAKDGGLDNMLDLLHESDKHPNVYAQGAKGPTSRFISNLLEKNEVGPEGAQIKVTDPSKVAASFLSNEDYGVRDRIDSLGLRAALEMARQSMAPGSKESVAIVQNSIKAKGLGPEKQYSAVRPFIVDNIAKTINNMAFQKGWEDWQASHGNSAQSYRDYKSSDYVTNQLPRSLAATVSIMNDPKFVFVKPGTIENGHQFIGKFTDNGADPKFWKKVQ